jgi:hypothetical protein
MSHKTQIKTKLSNLSYITKGLDEINIKYKVAKEGETLTTRGRYSVHEKVDLIVTEINGRSTNDAFGFQKQSDGTYQVIGDFYGSGTSSTQLRNIATTAAKKCEANDRLMQLGYNLESVNNDSSQELELKFTRWVD